MRKISNLELKVQLTNEYLRNVGVEKIYDNKLLEDLINFDQNNLETVTPRLNAFMLAILGSHMTPPFVSNNHISEYESFVQKSFFFDQDNIDTENEFDQFYLEFKEVKHMLFRGQREARWRLYSTLQRMWILEKLNEKCTYSEFIRQLIECGREKYKSNIEAILLENHIDTLNDIAVLGFLQHHETPTPLMDWTYSYQNALFFAIDSLEANSGMKEIDNYFSVYYIQEKDFGQGGMRKLLEDGLKEVGTELKLTYMRKIAESDEDFESMRKHFEQRSFFDLKRVKGSGLISYMNKIENIINIPLSYFSDNEPDSHLIFSLTNSNNIKNQNGVFTWNSDSMKPLELVGSELYNISKKESDPDDYRFSSCININKNLSSYILKKLNEDGITREMIYPDVSINTRHVYDECKNACT